jgi:hypothetical protein
MGSTGMNNTTGVGKQEPVGVEASASVVHVLPLKWSLSS